MGTTLQFAAEDLTYLQFFSINSLKKMSNMTGFQIVSFTTSNFISDVFPFSWLENRIMFFQKLDCKIADLLPNSFGSGFQMVWILK